jgi:hypothetical protein
VFISYLISLNHIFYLPNTPHYDGLYVPCSIETWSYFYTSGFPQLAK